MVTKNLVGWLKRWVSASMARGYFSLAFNFTMAAIWGLTGQEAMR